MCSSWVFPNSSRCKRTKIQPVGDVAYPPVDMGNRMAEASLFLFCVAAARGVHAIIENPAASMFFEFPVVKHALQRLLCHFVVTSLCSFSEEPLGQRAQKQLRLAYTSQASRFVPSVRRVCTCPGKEHLPLMKMDEKGRCSGTARLKQSQEYPQAFGSAVVQAWVNSAAVPLPSTLAADSAPAPPALACKRPAWMFQARASPSKRARAGRGASSGASPASPSFPPSHSTKGSSSGSQEPASVPPRQAWQTQTAAGPRRPKNVAASCAASWKRQR